MKRLFICTVFTFCFIYSSFSFSQSNSILEAGINDYKKGQYSFAVNSLKKYIQISEDNTEKPKAYFYLSLSYYFLKNYSLSLNYFNELSAKFRLSSYASQAHFWKGLIHQTQGQWQDAENAFLKYISATPNSELLESAYLAAANSEIALKKFEEAEKNLKFIIENYMDSSKHEEASVLYAYILMNNNKTKEAEEFLMKWIGKLGKTGEKYLYKDRFWLYKAELSLNAKDYEVAKLLLKKIDIYAKKSPSSDIALLRLSQIENILGNNKDSKAYLIRLANEFPYSKYNIDATLSMGMLEYEKNEYSEALVLFEQAKESTEKRLNSTDWIPRDERKRLNTLRIKSLYYIAEIYNKLSDKKGSIENFNKITDEDDILKKDSLIRLIEIHLKDNDTSELTTLISKHNSFLLQDKTNNDKYLFYRAKIEYLDKDLNGSSQTLDQIENKELYGVPIAVLRAKIFIKQNKENEAIKILQEVFPISPFDQKPYITLEIINLYFNAGEYEKVLKYEDYVKTYSKNLSDKEIRALIIKSEHLIALSYMQLKKNKEGISILSSLINEYKNEKLSEALSLLINRSYYYLGWMYYKSSKFINAANNFRKAKELDIGKDLIKDSYLMEAWSYFSKKDFETSAEIFEEIYKKYYPDKLGIKAYFQMGKSYENSNKKNKALNVYKSIYEEFPDSDYKDDALYQIILNLLNNKEFEKANELITKFKNSFPGTELYISLLVLQAESYMSASKFSEALSVYKFYIKRFDKSKNMDSIYYWGGYCAKKTKDHETAEEFLDQIIDNYPDSSFYPGALSILATIYKEENNFKKEEVIINKLLKVEKNGQKIKEYKKRLKELQLIKEGVDVKEAELKIDADKGDLEAKLKLAIYYYEEKDELRGLEILNEISKDDTKLIGSTANNKLGEHELSGKNYDKAITIFMNTVSSYRTSNEIKAEALYKASFCYFKLNKNEASMKIIDKLVSSFPDSDWTEKAIELKERINK